MEKQRTTLRSVYLSLKVLFFLEHERSDPDRENDPQEETEEEDPVGKGILDIDRLLDLLEAHAGDKGVRGDYGETDEKEIRGVHERHVITDGDNIEVEELGYPESQYSPEHV